MRVAIGNILLCGMVLAGCADASQKVWQELEPGLELARFDSRSRQVADGGDLIVLRVDLSGWEMSVLQPGPLTPDPGLTLERWCRKFGLAAAINAGMYQADHRTHVGYCKVDGKTTNPSANDYLSVMACDPMSSKDAPFRIFDLDEVTLREIGAKYRTVIQNLRLIKRDRENRWQPLGDQWAEAALGEDSLGRALLIYCGTAWSMYDFNEILLALPLDLVAAQHLEGRSQARLWVGESLGEVGLGWTKKMSPGAILPNVIGVTKKITDGE